MKPTETETTEIDWMSESSSTSQMTRGDRMQETYREQIYKPALVAWSDMRTRIGATIIGIYLLMALVALLDLWRRPETSQAPRYLGFFENMNYPLGTTASGTDLTALVIHSTPAILLMVTAGAVWATVLAVLVGTVSGYKGGTVDTVLMWISDFAMAIPGLPLVIILAVTFNPQNPILLGVILTVNYWAGLGRSLRSQVLTLRDESYVEASRTMGISTTRILRKDVIPNLMPYVMVNFVFAARFVVFSSIGLYFLGVLPYSGQNWGITLSLAYDGGAMFTLEAIHWLIVPMVAIVGLSVGLILLSQGLDRIFNPRVRTRLAGESKSTTVEDDEETVTEVL